LSSSGWGICLALYPGVSWDRRTIMRTGIFVLLLALSTAAVADAQTAKRVSLGGGFTFNDYSDSRFSAKNNFGFVPMYSLNRGSGKDGWGWDLKTAISFTQINASTAAT